MVSKRISPVVLGTILLLSGPVSAESSTGPSERPVAFARSVRPMTLVRPLVPEPPDLAALLLEDQHRSDGGPYRFAISRPVKATPQTDGMWEDLDANTLLWRIPIISPGALSLSLGFSRYHMPAHGKLFIYSADQSQVRGPFTSKDNRDDGKFRPPIILSDSAVLELAIPLAEVPDLEMELTSVSHGYRQFGPALAYQAMAKAAGCNYNVACPEGDNWRDQIRSVALCTVEIDGSTWGGTGTLVNNTAQDYRPYLLTAFHCFDLENLKDGKRDLQISTTEKQAIRDTMRVYWNFQATTCNGTSGELSQSQLGATFLAGYWYTDFALVELTEKPSPAFNVYYAGWDRSSTAPSGGVAIHHPQGDVKKISIEENTLAKRPITSSGVEHGTCFIVERWEKGLVEPVSSGCPFFALSGKGVVGQLIGGPKDPTCDNPGGAAFGSLYRSWNEGGSRETRLSDWLDPLNKGVMYLDGKDPSASTVGGRDWTWTWVAGHKSKRGEQYDLLPPSPYEQDTPGARCDAVSWVDSSGRLWLFGGAGFDKSHSGGAYPGDIKAGLDLWVINDGWRWVKGSAVLDDWIGVYGTQGVADAANRPHARSRAVSWTDSSGRLWLFGGWGPDGTGNGGRLNDLWRFDPTSGNWTWVKGSNTIDQSGVYRTQGVPHVANTPGAREGAVSWFDSSGQLWLFGGGGYDSTGQVAYLNDLWRFDLANGNWTWVKGSKTVGGVGQSGLYGTQGVTNAASTPGGREEAVSWTDSSGRLWLFGGWGPDSTGDVGYLNDLWQFDPASGNWTWVKGSKTVAGIGQSGVYGTQGVTNPANTPGGRKEAVSWTDSSGGLWLFGGYGLDSTVWEGHLNDLWRFDLASGNWIWVKGSKTGYSSGVYGASGVASAATTPGGRSGAVSWIDSSGRLWLFGGTDYGLNSDGRFEGGLLDDLWCLSLEFSPPTSGDGDGGLILD